MKTRLLFIVTAVLEVGIGLALLVSLALAVSILIGAPFETTADLVVGRVNGAALLALGAASWLLHSGMSVWCLANVAPGLETWRPRGREVT